MVTHRVYGRQNASAKGNLMHERIHREAKGKHGVLNEQQPLSECSISLITRAFLQTHIEYSNHDLVLRQDVLAMHPARVPHVELVRPVAGIQELVGAESPLAHLLTNWHRDAGIVCQEVHESLGVVQVMVTDLLPTAVIRVGPTAAVREFGRDRPNGVGVGLVVGKTATHAEDPIDMKPWCSGDQKATEQLVASRIIVVRPWEGNVIIGVVREAEPETVGLNSAVSLTLGNHWPIVNEG